MAVDPALKVALRRLLQPLLNDLTNDDLTALADLYDPWAPGQAVTAGELRQHDGMLYGCVQPHTTQLGWEPPATPALWTPRRITTGDQPEPWVQPTGAHDAYGLGARVTHAGSTWESMVPANVWEPGTPGTAALWREIS